MTYRPLTEQLVRRACADLVEALRPGVVGDPRTVLAMKPSTGRALSFGEVTRALIEAGWRPSPALSVEPVEEKDDDDNEDEDAGR